MSAVAQELTLPNEQHQLQVDLVSAAHPMGTLLNAGVYNHLKLVATHFAQSQLIPKHFQGKPQDVFIALHMAHRMGADPVMVLQNLYVVHGTPGWSAKFIIAQANMSKVFKGRIKFRYEGDESPDVTKSTLKVTAYATMDDGSDDVVEASASMDMARAEGWTSNTKYKGMQRQMLSYRAATLLVRLYAPEVLMGVQVADEIEDTVAAAGGPVVRTISPTALNASLVPAVQPEPVAEPVAEPAPAEDANRFEDLMLAIKEAETLDEVIRLDNETPRDTLTDAQAQLFNAALDKRAKALQK